MSTPYTDDPWTDRLSLAVDGELTADEGTLLDAHLAECARCRATLDELRAVVARARALPEGQDPGTDLWPAVESRIAAFARSEAALEHEESARTAAYAPPAIPAAVFRRPGRARGLTLSWPQLVAAGLALVALSSGGVWVGLHRGSLGLGGPGGVPSGAGAAGPSGTAALTASVPAVANADPRYAREVAELERALAERRSRLDPATVKTIESNLHIIDLAAAQAAQALAADPSNPYLKDYLSRTMQRKVDVLKQATQFASAP